MNEVLYFCTCCVYHSKAFQKYIEPSMQYADIVIPRGKERERGGGRDVM